MIKTKRKKILVVIPKLFKGGGAEKVSMEIGGLLENLGNDVSYFTFHEGQNIKNEHSLKYSENKLDKFLRMFTIPFILFKYSRKNDIDIIISHTERANYISILSNFINKNKLKVFTVTHNYKYINKLCNYLFISILYKYASCNVAVSKGIEKKLKEKYSLINTKTIYNPFDFENIKKLAEENIEDKDRNLFVNNKITFINIGRLHKQKGQKYLIEAFANYYDKNPKSQLVILGEGELRNQLQNQIDKLGMNKHIHLLGNRSNVFPYLKKSDCFVLSSLWEGFGLVLVEAMSVGLPIISTNCKSGPSEILPKEFKFVDIKEDLTLGIYKSMNNIQYNTVKYYSLETFKLSNISLTWEKLIDDELSK